MKELITPLKVSGKLDVCIFSFYGKSTAILALKMAQNKINSKIASIFSCTVLFQFNFNLSFISNFLNLNALFGWT